MANTALTIENALNKLQLANDTNVGAFKCSKFSQDGIFVISKSMFFFTFLSEDENDIKIEEFKYPLVQGIFIPQENDNSPEVTLAGVPHKKYLEIKYGPLNIRFHFFRLQDFIQAGASLQSIIPDKIQNIPFSEPVLKKKVLNVEEPVNEQKENSENELNKNPKINKIPNTARVSDRFLHVASRTVMNYQAVSLKSKEESPEKNHNFNKTIISKPVVNKEKPPEENNEKPLAVPPSLLENEFTNSKIRRNDMSATTIIRKDELINTLNSRNELNKVHQHAKVSDKFLQAASDSRIRTEPVILKASPLKSTFNGKKLIINLIYLFVIFVFFQTPFSKPVKGWLYKVYKQPDKIIYFMNIVKIESCEIEMNTIGRIVMVYYKTNQSFPPDLDQYINKSFSDNDKKDHTKDSWGKEYTFEKQDKGFQIISSGPDKKMGTRDDIIKVFNIDYDPSTVK